MHWWGKLSEPSCNLEQVLVNARLNINRQFSLNSSGASPQLKSLILLCYHVQQGPLIIFSSIKF